MKYLLENTKLMGGECNMFVGREKELSALNRLYNSEKFEFAVIYGRRRVGKTETLRKFCEGKECIFYACTESPDEQQLKAFSERVLQKNHAAAKYIKHFSLIEKLSLALMIAFACWSVITFSLYSLLLFDKLGN